MREKRFLYFRSYSDLELWPLHLKFAPRVIH